MPALKYLDPVTGTYKTLVGIMGPTGPAGIADPAAVTSGVWGTAPLDKYGVDPSLGEPTYIDSAGKLRGRPQMIPSENILDITDSPGLYPLGLSIMCMTAVDSVAKGWPTSGTVVTYRRSPVDQVVHQYFYQNHTPQAGAPFMQFRTGNGANNPAWSSWLTQYGTSSEKQYASRRAHVGNTSIPSAAFTNVPFDTPVSEDGIIWSVTNSRFDIPVDGYYQVEGGVLFPGNATGLRAAAIYLDSVSVASANYSNGGASQTTSALASVTVKALAGQYITLRAYQNSGVALALVSSASNNFLSVTKVPAPVAGGAQFGERNYSAVRKHSSTITVPSATFTPVPWDQMEVDDGIPFATPIFTAPVSGYYDVEASIIFPPNATGYRQLRLLLNGSTQSASNAAGAVGGETTVSITKTVLCAAGDTLQFNLYQTSGASMTISASAANNFISITKVPAPVVGGNAASGVWGSGELASLGTDSLVGRPVFVDSRGQLRSAPTMIPSTKIAADLPNTYPFGLTTLALTNAENLAGGWPGGSMWSNIITVRGGTGTSGYATQQWQRFTTDGKLQEILYRTGNVGSGWMPWQTVMGPDTGWTDLTNFSTDWANYGGTYCNAQYRKIGKSVKLRGLVKVGVAKTAASQVLTLPAGVTPEYPVLKMVMVSGTVVTGAASTGTAHTHSAGYQMGMRLDILVGGQLSVAATTVWSIGVNGYLSLDDIEYETP